MADQTVQAQGNTDQVRAFKVLQGLYIVGQHLANGRAQGLEPAALRRGPVPPVAGSAVGLLCPLAAVILFQATLVCDQ